jgi:hypothetical protein
MKTKSFFNIEGIFTNLRCFQLGIENIEMFINIYKDSQDDIHVESLTSIGQFMDMEEAFMEENEDLIDKVGLLEIKAIDDRF